MCGEVCWRDIAEPIEACLVNMVVQAVHSRERRGSQWTVGGQCNS